MFKDDVTPDDSLLEQIFTTNQPRTISVFLQNWDKCVFKAGFQDHRSTCVVRLEAENESPRSFPMVAAMQQIAATITPEIIPRTFRVGKAHNAQGRKFHFSVNEFVEGDVLEDVWHQMSAGEHSAVVTELVEALEKLHSVRLSDKGVKEIVNKTLRENGDEVPESLEQPGVFGGPHTGFVNGGLALLHCIMERRQLKKPFCTVETIVDSPDIKVQSNFQELGLVTLKKSDIDVWPGEAVFCHNDLTPRNIILQKHDPSSGKATRKLAGIIDWELAGFYPASYELSLQDTYPGANRHLSFYVLLKEHMQKLVPRSSSQIVLLQAMELIFESQQRSLLEGTNVPAHIRKRLMEKSKMVRHKDPYVGWTRSQQDEPFPDSAAIQKLENDVVKEMAARKLIKQHKKDGSGKVCPR